MAPPASPPMAPPMAPPAAPMAPPPAPVQNNWTPPPPPQPQPEPEPVQQEDPIEGYYDDAGNWWYLDVDGQYKMWSGE
eukprot:UN03830